MIEAKNWKWIASRTLALTVGLAFVLLGAAGVSVAQSPATAKSAPAAAAQKASSAESADKGLNTGIKVHGHWVIEVKNPDGTVTAHREFENAIQPSGESYIASLLAGSSSSGGLSILLNGAGSSLDIESESLGINFDLQFPEAGPCLPFATPEAFTTVYKSTGPSAGTGCLIAGGASAGNPTFLGVFCAQASPQSCSNNLTVSSPTLSNFQFSGTTIALMGSVPVTSQLTGQFITDVETFFTTCSGTATPSDCLNASTSQTDPTASSIFTQRALDGNTPTGAAAGDPNPVPYSPGQTIAVTVAISFQ